MAEKDRNLYWLGFNQRNINSNKLHSKKLFAAVRANHTKLQKWCTQFGTKYLPTASHSCVQLSSMDFSGSLYIQRMELGSVLILKHLETKRATITERTKGCITTKPPEDLWWKAAGPPELLLAVKKNGVYPWETKHQPIFNVWTTDATEAEKKP